MDKIQEFWLEVRALFNSITKEADSSWVRRSPKIKSAEIMMVIFKLVAGRNFQGYGPSLAEVWERFFDWGLEQSAPPANSSFCEARYKLHEDSFKLMSRQVVSAFLKIFSPKLWHGHRIFGLDGTRLNLPRPLRNARYPVPKGAYYPQGLLCCLYELTRKIPFEFGLSPTLNERTLASRLIRQLNKNDVIVFDRGFLAYWLLECLQVHGLYGVFRVQSHSFEAIEKFMASSQHDSIVDITPNFLSRKQSLKYAGILHETISLRLIKYERNGTTFCLATTLLDQSISIDELADLYMNRWNIEELYKVSKKYFQIEDFHSQCARGIKQEIYAHFILITFARFFACTAETQLESSNKNRHDNQKRHSTSQPRQVNFKNCLQTLARNLEKLLWAPEKSIEILLARIIALVKRLKTKIRPDRHYPRQSRKPGYKWSLGGYQARRKHALDAGN